MIYLIWIFREDNIDLIYKLFEFSFYYNEIVVIIIYVKVLLFEKVKWNINSVFINNCFVYKFWYE